MFNPPRVHSGHGGDCHDDDPPAPPVAHSRVNCAAVSRSSAQTSSCNAVGPGVSSASSLASRALRLALSQPADDVVKSQNESPLDNDCVTKLQTRSSCCNRTLSSCSSSLVSRIVIHFAEAIDPCPVVWSWCNQMSRISHSEAIRLASCKDTASSLFDPGSRADGSIPRTPTTCHVSFD